MQVFFRLTDVLIDDSRQIHPVDIHFQPGGEDPGSKCLAGAAGSAEQGAHPQIALQLKGGPQVSDHLLPITTALFQLLQSIAGFLTDHQIAPGTARIQSRGQGVEQLVIERAASLANMPGSDLLRPIKAGIGNCHAAGFIDVKTGQVKTFADFTKIFGCVPVKHFFPVAPPLPGVGCT